MYGPSPCSPDGSVRRPRSGAAMRPTCLLAAVITGLTVMTSASATASPTDAAFDTATGALNVDRAAYMSKHDIVYNRPDTNPLHGLTVGNGRMGAMVWQNNGLTMQVSGVDAAQQTAFGAGVVGLSTTPQQDIVQQRLSLYDGTLTT